MRKGIGFILAFILTIGLAFGVQQVVSSRSHAHHPTTSQQAASSSKASLQKPQAKNPRSKKNSAGDQKRAKRSSAKKLAGKSESQSSSAKKARTNNLKPAADQGKTKQAASSKPSADNPTKTPKDDKVGQVNHKSQTKIVKGHAKAPVRSRASHANTIRIHLTVDGYKKVFYSKSMTVKKKSNAFSVLKQTKLKVSYIPGYSVYVNGINGLKENDIKAGSGWMFSVNKKFIDHAANLTPLKNGDQVRWYFTTKGY